MGEFFVVQMKCNINLQPAIKLYQDAGSAQSYRDNFGPPIVIASIMPPDCRGIRKLKIATDKNVRSGALVLALTLRNSVERHLKYLPVHRVTAMHKLSIKVEIHIR